ncbi:MAG: SDR family oxidoreductase [Myxococcales bacterium]|nr:SDR family oxidoreductase [Myxococcales bacterium]
MRALVVGANGLVGSRLVAELLRREHRVTAMGRGPVRVTSKVPWVSLDLSEAERVTMTIEVTKPEVIINCAAMTDVDGCEREPAKAWTANVEGVATLSRAARVAGSHVVHVSTDYVFDGDAGPYDVDALPNPRGVYALSKHAGEAAVRALCEKDRWAIARTAVVYGWPAAGQKNFGSWLVDTLSKGQTVKLFEDQWVSPSLALNVAQMLADLAEKALPGIWHTCGASVVDRVTFGKKLCERFGFDAALIQPSRMADVKLLSPRPAKSGLVVTRTAEALAHQPLALDESLERFHDEFRKVST